MGDVDVDVPPGGKGGAGAGDVDRPVWQPNFSSRRSLPGAARLRAVASASARMLSALVVLGIALLAPRRALASLSVERRACCAVYTVITHAYDYPAHLGECQRVKDDGAFTATSNSCSCSFYLYHDDTTPGPGEPWLGRRRELPENFTDASPKLQASAWKLRRPDDFDACPSTIFIDSNVQVIRDPSPLLDACGSGVCMFSLGRNISEEIAWLVNNAHANETGASRLRAEYRPYLAQPAWYSKVIVRTNGDPTSSSRLRCFEDHWLEALASSPVERDQARFTLQTPHTYSPIHPPTHTHTHTTNTSSAITISMIRSPHGPQVHINAALAACGTRMQELRATSGRLQSADFMGRMIRPPFDDLNFNSYFISSGDHKAERAHNGEEDPASRRLRTELQGRDGELLPPARERRRRMLRQRAAARREPDDEPPAAAHSPRALSPGSLRP